MINSFCSRLNKAYECNLRLPHSGLLQKPRKEMNFFYEAVLAKRDFSYREVKR
jgi:hypothetical protein